MKKINFVLFMLVSFAIFTNFTCEDFKKKQKQKMDQVITKYTESAGKQIVNCCSNNPIKIYTEYKSYQTLHNGRLSINIYIKWESGDTGCTFSYTGELTVDSDGCNPRFRKINRTKSSIFCPIITNCESSCVLSECL